MLLQRIWYAHNFDGFSCDKIEKKYERSAVLINRRGKMSGLVNRSKWVGNITSNFLVWVESSPVDP